MPQQPKCPECSTDVLPSWDWCMACGYDPEGLKPSSWSAGTTTRVQGTSSSTLVAPRTATAVIENARPQEITDPDWVQHQPGHRISLVATLGVLAAILIAVAGLVFVVLMVLNQPVGRTGTDAMPVPVTVSGRVAPAAA